MIKRFVYIILFYFFNACIANAVIDVVYPSSLNATVNSSSIFFIGNTDLNSDFYINFQPVKLWQNKFFVYVVPLEIGNNKIILTSKKNNKEEKITYNIIRKNLTSSSNIKLNYIPKNENEYLYTKTINDNSTIRALPSTSSARIIDLPKNTILYLAGKKGDYYKIEESGDSEFWIHKSNIEEPVSISKRMPAIIKKQKLEDDDLYDYFKIYISHPVLYTVKQTDNTIKLTLYGVENKDKNDAGLNNYEHTFEYDMPILGFDCYYDENKFVFRKAKNPELKKTQNLLSGIKIFIDAGHGGSEKGAVGPTRVNEKDINLKIASYLIDLLKAEGAIVSYSRNDDRKLNLYDRVNIAKKNNALISISIHNNSLPNGRNPYTIHGTETHYYNENAKLLAEIIKNNLASDLNLKDNGIHKSSFAMSRSTNPVSVLIEVAYMINPEEYILLQDSNFQKKAAVSIKNSIEKYISLIKK